MLVRVISLQVVNIKLKMVKLLRMRDKMYSTYVKYVYLFGVNISGLTQMTTLSSSSLYDLFDAWLGQLGILICVDWT